MGNITEIREMAEMQVTKESETEVIKLQLKETKPVIINEIEYNSIQKAIKACGEIESIIKLTRNIEPAETITIEEQQKITIDLNGYTMKNYPEITNNGTLKIIDSSETKNGKIIGLTGRGIKNNRVLELNGSSIIDTGEGIYNTRELIVNGGTISNNTYGIYNTSGNVTINNGGTISSNIYGVYNTTGIVTINNGSTILSNKYGIYNYSGTTNINSNIAEGDYGAYNAGGTTNINREVQINSNDTGVYNTGGATNIKEGVRINSNTGISNTGGTVNIGEQGIMNPDSPVIIGETYGLVNKSTVNMYDGQIKGKTGATQGYITHTETGYAVANKTEGEYFVDYLALAGTISTVAQVNGIDYSNLQSAINSIVEGGEATVKLTNGIITTDKLQIKEGQNIILDMNGKTISSDLEITLENAGTLTIIDTAGSNVAKISSSIGTAIKNTGTLNLGQNDGTVSQELITIEGTTVGIENSGTLNFYDGTVNGASAISGTITSRAEGYVIRTTTVNGKERYYLTT